MTPDGGARGRPGERATSARPRALVLLGACAGLAASAVAGAVVAGAVVPSDPINRIAGTGAAGGTGDGGPALLAALDAPQGVAVDAQGRILVVDGAGGRIRRIDADGTIRAFAGGFGEPADVAVDAQGTVYVAGASDNRVFAVSPAGVVSNFAGDGTATSGGDGGPATAAGVNEPRGVAVDRAGNVYVAETGGDRIRRVEPGGVIRAFAGSGAPGFAGDGGPAAAAQLWGPRDVAVAPDGSVVIADSNNGRVRRVSAGVVATVAGNGDSPGSCPATPVDAGSTPLDFPVSVAVDGSGNVFTASQGCVTKLDGAGTLRRLAGDGAGGGGDSGDGGPAVQAKIRPSGLAVDPAGSLVISEGLNNKVRRVLNAAPTAAFAATTPEPLTVAVDAAGSSAGQPGEALSAFTWDFGDGAGGQGASARHAYAAPGTYSVTLEVRDDSGATARTSRAVTVDPPPPPPITIRLTAASVAGGYRGGRLRASLRLAGTSSGGGTAAVTLRRTVGPRAVGLVTTATLGLRVARPGRFTARLPLPATLAPGTYRIALDAEPVAGRRGTATVRRPPVGLLRRAFVSGIVNGPAGRSFPPTARRLFCTFDFAVLPVPGGGRLVTTEWSAPGASLGRVAKPLARRVVGVVSRSPRLRPGRYTCTLRVGDAVLRRVTAGVRP